MCCLSLVHLLHWGGGLPNRLNSVVMQVELIGTVSERGGCIACLSPAPIENLICTPPGNRE